MLDEERIAQLLQDGKGCAQVQVQVGLQWRGESNEQLVQAVSGLCGGMQKGLACGALAGAACMLALFDEAVAKQRMVPALVDWFAQTYGDSNGSIDCLTILEGDRANRFERCPQLIEDVCMQARDILEDNDFTLLDIEG